MEVLRKYGAATTILFPLIDAGTNDFESTPVTFAAGDTKIIKDEGAAANTTNNPAHEGNGVYSLALTATEMQAARIVITIIDSATKTWEDQAIIISTYGNASGQHAFDLDTATQSVNVLQISGDSTAADNLEADYDGTGYAKTNSTIGTATSVTNQVTADMTAISGDTTAANNCESFFDNTGFTASNSTVGTVTTLTGHTAQTGDSFARLGAPAGASVSADIAAIEAQTDDIGVAGAGLSNIPWNASWDAEVQSEVNDALVALALDHLVSTSVTGTDVANNSIIARMVSSAATADWDTFVNTDDSLQAISESGGGGPTAADIADAVWDESTTGHTTAGTFGEQVKTDIDAILVDTSTTLDGKIDTVDGNVDAIKAKTDSLTFTVANHVDANALAISGDTTAADNLELMYDGTGYTDDTAPASRAQVAGIGAASGGSLNFEVQEDNTGGAIKGASFVGVQTGTFVNTEAEDGTLHTIDDTGNAIDIVYGFDIGGSRLATEVTFKGYLDSANDTITVQAYDFVGSDWETRTVITGQNGTDNITQTVPLLTKHTGTGTDLGKVYLRFVNSAQTNPQLNVDEFLCAAVASQATIGYAGGAVWLDTNASNTNTESFVDGTADNPVSTIAAARTIADNLNLKVIHCLPGSSFTLAQSFDDFEFIGFGYTVALGGQSVSGTLFRNATITGNDDGSNVIPTVYNLCLMGNNTLGTNKMNQCGFSGPTSIIRNRK